MTTEVPTTEQGSAAIRTGGTTGGATTPGGDTSNLRPRSAMGSRVEGTSQEPTRGGERDDPQYLQAQNQPYFYISEDYSPYVKSEDPNLTKEENAYLSSIQVGCLLDVVSNETNRIFNYIRGSVPKLQMLPNGVSTYYHWSRYIEQALHLYGKNRVSGFINGSIEGSIPAYQRYFGTPPTLDGGARVLGPKLLPAELAEFRRKEDDMEAAAAIMGSLHVSIHNLLLGEKINNSSAVELWKMIREKCVPSGPHARNLVQNMILQYNPANKSVETIVQELRQLFYHYLTTRGKPVEEEDKISHLLRCLPQSMNNFKTTVNYLLEDTDKSAEFESIAVKAIAHAQSILNEEMQRQFYLTPTPTMGHQPSFPVPGGTQNQLLLGYNISQIPNPLGGFYPSGQPQQQQPPNVSPSSSNNTDGPRTPSPTQNVSPQMPQQYNTPFRRNITCYHCGDQGHTAERCPRAAAGEPKTYVPKYLRDQGYIRPAATQPTTQQAPVQQAQGAHFVPSHNEVSYWAGEYPTGLGIDGADLEDLTF
ncbi:unnamed protein product [Parajaminaea phylloscopi]